MTSNTRLAVVTLGLVVLLTACAQVDDEVGTGAVGQEVSVDRGLEALAELCIEGDAAACDDLWSLTEVGTEFEWLGASCGGRIPIVEDPPPSGDCASQFGSQLPDPAGSQSTTIAPTTAPATAATASLVPVLGAPSDGTWIVILMSASEADGGEAAAIQRAAVLTAEGDIPTGVFRSDDYASLNSGFWVVYTGQFDAPEAAAGRCSQLAQLVPECYHRLVEN